MTTVVGRHDELVRIERFLSYAEQGCATLIFEGEAGIGKTTVWREALRLAEERGLRALTARPSQAEAKLGFALLADLLAPVDEALLRPRDPGGDRARALGAQA